MLTNFPLASQVLTGLFLNITLSGPSSPSETFNRTLVDRIGYAARQQMTPPQDLSVNPSSPPIITPFDLTTLNILPGLQGTGAANFVQDQSNEEINAVSSDSNATTIDQTGALITLGQAELANFAVASDQEAANLEHGFSITSYFALPRITAFSSQAQTAASGSGSTFSFSFDLINDTPRVIGTPGQNEQAVLAFTSARGLFDSVLEAHTLPVLGGGQNLSASAIIQESIQQGIPLNTISAANLSLLQSLNLPADAVARITAEAQTGLTVIVPTRPLEINGSNTTAWFVSDPATGEFIAQSQTGQNQGVAEFGLTEALVVSLYAHLFAFDVLKILAKGGQPSVSDVKDATIDLLTALGPFAVPALAIKLALISGVLEAFLKIFDDPPLPPELVNLQIPFPGTRRATGVAQIGAEQSGQPGPVASSLQESNVAVVGTMSGSWLSDSTSILTISSIDTTNATVMNSLGESAGTGPVAVLTSASLQAAVAGTAEYAVSGQGSLSFYRSVESTLGVSGDWQNYTATVTGNVSITLTVPTGALTLNGQALPAGTYTITTNSATLSGSGTTSSPTFSGPAAITATNGTINLGPGSGTLSVGGKPLDPADETTLDGYSGTITVSANGDGTDSVSLSGNAGNVLQVTTSPATLTTDQNTPVTFAANVQTSLADTYNLTANAPPGWTVTIDSKRQRHRDARAGACRAARIRSRSSPSRRPIPTSRRRRPSR